MPYQITHRTVIGERPSQAPLGWSIYNAPRPLYASPYPGQLDDYGHPAYALWQGDFCSGIFYAAINPSDNDYARLVELNRQQHAIELHYVTEQEAFDIGVAQILYHNGDTTENRTILDDPHNRSWVIDRYLDLVNHGDAAGLII